MELLFAMDDNLTSEDGRSLNSLSKEKMLIRILFRLYYNVYLVTWFYGNKNYKNISLFRCFDHFIVISHFCAYLARI